MAWHFRILADELNLMRLYSLQTVINCVRNALILEKGSVYSLMLFIEALVGKRVILIIENGAPGNNHFEK